MIMTVMVTLLIIILISPATCWMEGFLESAILPAILEVTDVSLCYFYILLVELIVNLSINAE